jgi:glycosyltransferase involved in cell wall biosynthesis
MTIRDDQGLMGAEDRLARASANIRILADALAQAVAAQAAAPAAEPAQRPARLPPPGRSRGRAAVVCWDLGHNPAGRAHVLYDLLARDWQVDLVGPLWQRYGTALWGPLRELGLNLRAFRCRTLDDFLPQAVFHATLVRYDLVHVCKPRLPGLLLGQLIRDHSRCPMIVDVDDHELAFFNEAPPAALEEFLAGAEAALVEPYGELATRFAETLIAGADGITVSNVALQRRFGGVPVRHARDETAFDPATFDRPAIRASLGIAPEDFALIFVGTPRAHKGVGVVARALQSLGDRRFCFHVFGSPDRQLRSELESCAEARIHLHGEIPFDQLPRILAAADAVPLLQDPAHPISAYQIPAKISDATALGCPVLMTEIPPVADLVAQGGVVAVTPESFAPTLLRLRAERDAGAGRGERIRNFFLQELSSTVNRARLALVVDQAAARAARPLPPDWQAMRTAAFDVFGRRARAAQDPLLALPAIAGARQGAPDVAFFWKQNDTGLYGRRSDMVLRHMLASGRVRRAMMFDAPMGRPEIERQLEGGGGTQGPLVLRYTLARWLRGLDTERWAQRVTIFADRDFPRLLDVTLPQRSEAPDLVEAALREGGFDPANTIAWVCPVVWDFPVVAQRLRFRHVVADLIDDQRAWKASPAYTQRLDACYRETLGRADTVFTNCEPVAEAFRDVAPDIHVVPNGAERFDRHPGPLPLPPALAKLPRPLIGYVGNLRDRIDWALLEAVARQRPRWTLVLAGSAHDNPAAEALGRLPNVHLLGVVEYPALLAHLRAFDVGIVPHEASQLTERMNPLKVYNYFAAGLPIVATEIANMEEMRPFISVATGAEAFVAAIEAALRRGRGIPEEGAPLLDEIGWDSRVATMLDVVERDMRRAGRARRWP